VESRAAGGASRRASSLGAAGAASPRVGSTGAAALLLQGRGEEAGLGAVPGVIAKLPRSEEGWRAGFYKMTAPLSQAIG
jgi:hypothetical protein